MRGPSIMLGGITALAIGLAAVFASTPAPSQEAPPLLQGLIVFCNTPEQVRGVIELGGTLSPAAAVEAFNAKQGANVCGHNVMIFRVGPIVGKAKNERFSLAIREVTIYGGVINGVPVMATESEKQYAPAPDPDAVTTPKRAA